jgi:pyruvate dehydrogenase E2 component (dihydrolipoamide acetyltransferase)
MDILMPQLGETVAEGTITVWHKSVGDTVSPGDSLFEIETDKTSMEVPTTVGGVLTAIRVAAGVTVPVGSVVAVLEGAEIPNSRPTQQVAPVASAMAPKRPFDPFHSVRTPERNFGPATMRNGVQVTRSWADHRPTPGRLPERGRR